MSFCCLRFSRVLLLQRRDTRKWNTIKSTSFRPCYLAFLFFQKRREGWIETQENINTYLLTFQIIQSCLICVPVSFGTSSFPVRYIDLWKIVCTRWGPFTFNSRICRTRKTTTLARLVNAQKCVASSKDSACDFGRNQQRKALYSASFDSSPKSLFSLKQRSSRKILERMEFNLSTRQNMGRFRRWNYMTGSFYGLTGGRGVCVCLTYHKFITLYCQCTIFI